MQAAMIAKKPRKQAISGRFRAGCTYRGRIKDDHKIDFACGTGGFLVSWIKQLQDQVKTTEDSEAMHNSIYGIEKKQFPYMLCVTNMLLHGVDVPRVYHDNSLLKDVLDYTEKDQFDVVLMNPPLSIVA